MSHASSWPPKSKMERDYWVPYEMRCRYAWTWWKMYVDEMNRLGAIERVGLLLRARVAAEGA